jgi:hypothetical protein
MSREPGVPTRTCIVLPKPNKWNDKLDVCRHMFMSKKVAMMIKIKHVNYFLKVKNHTILTYRKGPGG